MGASPPGSSQEHSPPQTGARAALRRPPILALTQMLHQATVPRSVPSLVVATRLQLRLVPVQGLDVLAGKVSPSPESPWS